MAYAAMFPGPLPEQTAPQLSAYRNRPLGSLVKNAVLCYANPADAAGNHIGYVSESARGHDRHRVWRASGREWRAGHRQQSAVRRDLVGGNVVGRLVGNEGKFRAAAGCGVGGQRAKNDA